MSVKRKVTEMTKWHDNVTGGNARFIELIQVFSAVSDGMLLAVASVMKTQKIEFTNREQAERQIRAFRALGLYARYLGAVDGYYYISVETGE